MANGTCMENLPDLLIFVPSASLNRQDHSIKDTYILLIFLYTTHYCIILYMIQSLQFALRQNCPFREHNQGRRDKHMDPPMVGILNSPNVG